jgi:hypothetical protein
VRIHSERKGSQAHTLKQYRVEVKSRTLLTAAKKGIVRVKQLGEWKPAESSVLVESITDSQPDLEGTTSRVWVPAPLMEHFLPSLVCAFTKRGGKQKQKQPVSPAMASSSHLQDCEILELTDSESDREAAGTPPVPSKGKRRCLDFNALETLDLTRSD